MTLITAPSRKSAALADLKKTRLRGGGDAGPRIGAAPPLSAHPELPRDDRPRPADPLMAIYRRGDLAMLIALALYAAASVPILLLMQRPSLRSCEGIELSCHQAAGALRGAVCCAARRLGRDGIRVGAMRAGAARWGKVAAVAAHAAARGCGLVSPLLLPWWPQRPAG
ncbi:hypothetical protein [Tepidimonas alkaliphilus]|uniref:hypothetical protein n=1 Tax=Tepidimonas alkaliphilus TaxID=2588942 RepID=UPI00117E99BE|nr:hypothetical protein [Tepidimonas alkaliphilus]